VQSQVEPASVPNDQIKFEKENEGDKTNTPSTVPDQVPPDTSQPAPVELAKSALENTLIDKKAHGASDGHSQSTDHTQLPATCQTTMMDVGVSDVVNNRTKPLVGNVMPQIPNVQQAPIPVYADESTSLNEVTATAPVARDATVNIGPSISDSPATSRVRIMPKEPELNDSKPTSTFIGSTIGTLIDQTSDSAKPVDPLSALDQSANAARKQPAPDAKSEMFVRHSDVHNTGTDWLDYWWVPVLGISGVVVGYMLYRNLKKTQPKDPTPSSSTVTQGYARVNDPNRTAMF
jgi:hypothetical protein